MVRERECVEECWGLGVACHAGHATPTEAPDTNIAVARRNMSDEMSFTHA